MLKHLQIQNFALIEHAEIDFHGGLSVLTGETGAGKSIIIGALGLLLGRRADVQNIKKGAAKCIVEGTFSVTDFDLKAFLSEHDIDDDGTTCCLRREINVGGKSRNFVNDSPVGLAVFRQLGLQLIDIHSQHQNLLLGKPDFVRDVLDSYAGCQALRRRYEEEYKAYVEATRAFDEQRRSTEARQKELDFLQFQLSQLTEAGLTDGEQEEAEEEQKVLSHAEELRGTFYRAALCLDGDGEAEGVLSRLKQAAQLLNGVAELHAGADELGARLESCRVELKDVAEELDRLQDQTSVDPRRLEEVEQRLNTIYTLEQKFHVSTVAELLAVQSDLQAQVDGIEHADERLEELQQQVQAAAAAVQTTGGALTDKRRDAAAKLQKALLDQLQSLGLPNAAVCFDFLSLEQPAAYGTADVAFLFSSNKSLDMQPVEKVASGGEISRLMLALKSIISERAHLPTIVFDEIDTGVSGKMAEQMGRTMQHLARHCQVICITHLPQIAALGDHHYRVEKDDRESGVSTHISELSDEERVQEIAHMLSGAQVSEAAVGNARELLNKSKA